MASKHHDCSDSIASSVDKGMKKKSQKEKVEDRSVEAITSKMRQLHGNPDVKFKAEIEYQRQTTRPIQNNCGQEINERLEDVFQDEVLREFPRMKDFRMFARSTMGLRLSNYDVINTTENAPSSVEDQKMELLFLWKQKKGREGTPALIRETVKGYLRHQENNNA